MREKWLVIIINGVAYDFYIVNDGDIGQKQFDV